MKTGTAGNKPAFGSKRIKTAGTALADVHTDGKTMSYRQIKLRELQKRAAAGEQLKVQLRRAPWDKCDPKHAIEVLAATSTMRWTRVGFIPGNVAWWLAPKMDAKLMVCVKHAEITGRYNAGTACDPNCTKGTRLGLELLIVFDARMPQYHRFDNGTYGWYVREAEAGMQDNGTI